MPTGTGSTVAHGRGPAPVVGRAPFHGLVWLVWAFSASLSVQLAPNPVYVAVVVLIAALLVGRFRTDAALARAFPALIIVGVAFGLVRLVLAALTTHGSTGRVLVTLPSITLPRLLGGFQVGGPVEVDVLTQTAADVIPVIGIMAVFGAFNAVVAHHELLRSAAACAPRTGTGRHRRHHDRSRHPPLGPRGARGRVRPSRVRASAGPPGAHAAPGVGDQHGAGDRPGRLHGRARLRSPRTRPVRSARPRG